MKKKKIFEEFDDCFGVWDTQEQSKIEQFSGNDNLYQLLCKEVDYTSESIINIKLEKLGVQFLQDYNNDLQILCDRWIKNQTMRKQIEIKFYFLQVDHDNLAALDKFYEILKRKIKNKDENFTQSGKVILDEENSFTFNSQIYKISLQGKDKQNQQQQSYEILKQIVEQLQKKLKNQSDIQSSLFLLNSEMIQEKLQELSKTLQEEIEFNLLTKFYHQIILIVPASSQQVQNYKNLGLINRKVQIFFIQQKKYVFTEPNKMFVKLLINLIKNPSIPLLSRNIYVQFINSFGLYATNYNQQLQKFKVALFLYFKWCPSQIRDNLYCRITDKTSKSKVFDEYIKLRILLKQSLDTIQYFIKNMKRKIQQLEKHRRFQIIDFKQKIFNGICKESSQFFALPQSFAEDEILNIITNLFIESISKNISDPEQLINLIQSNIIETQAIQNKQNNIFLNNSSTKKFKDRIIQIVQSTYLMDLEQQNIIAKKDRIEFQINKFFRENITSTIIYLEKQMSEFIFNNEDELQKHFSPDILENFHCLFYRNSTNAPDNNEASMVYTPFYKAKQLYALLGPSSLNVKASEIYGEIQNQKFQTFNNECYHNCIGEMKLLGLLEDTQKLIPTFQKTFFAKNVYQNFAND